MAIVELEKRGAHAIIWMDNPPLNALSAALRKGLQDALRAVEADDGLKGAVLAGRGRAFIAGADITEFGKPFAPPGLPELVNELEALSKPVVAAIQGHALGGGLETALGCHFRVGGPKASVGLPEVSLGLIPGAAGTQRLPRLIGLDGALKLITSGRPVGAKAAAELGILDDATDGDVVEAALAYLAAHDGDELAERRLSAREVPDTDENRETIAAWKDRVAKTQPGVLAPAAAVESAEAAIGQPFSVGETKERELFADLMKGPQSAALRHLFFAERLSAKVPGLDAKPRPLKKVAVIGAGTMGSGIAVSALNAGFAVTILEMSDEALAAGVGRIRAALEAGVKRGKLRPEDVDARMSLLRGVTSYADLADVDLVVEAVFEDMGVKEKVFSALEEHCKPGAVLASNTSYLDLDQIADKTGRPGDVVGLHFFSPAHVMRLLEIVRGAKTDPDVLATALAFGKKLRKTMVVAGVCPGFIGNRLYRDYQREAGQVLMQGATPSQIDGALTAWGMKMGPLAVSDLSGLDIGYMARKASPGLVDPTAFRVHDRLVEGGDKGRKTGAGFYAYDGGRPTENPKVAGFQAEEAKAAGIAPREVPDEEIVERCVFALTNEGARALAEGIAARASDIDVVYVNGYGFPRHRGGPMQYAQAVGLETVVERVKAFGWEPAPLLVEAAKSGRWPK